MPGKKPKERQRYMLRINDTLVEVTREVYLAWYQAGRKERYQVEKMQRHGVCSMEELQEKGYDCSFSILSPEEIVIRMSEIQELEEAMREEDSKSTTAKLSDEWDELMSKLEDVIYDELEGVAVKIVTERIVDKYDVDTDILIAEYMESGDLEESFKIAAEECDCGWKTDITKRILK